MWADFYVYNLTAASVTRSAMHALKGGGVVANAPFCTR